MAWSEAARYAPSTGYIEGSAKVIAAMVEFSDLTLTAFDNDTFREQFELDFKSSMAKSAGCSEDNVLVLGYMSGSVQVNSTVRLEDTDEQAAVDDFIAALQTDITSIFTSEEFQGYGVLNSTSVTVATIDPSPPPNPPPCPNTPPSSPSPPEITGDSSSDDDTSLILIIVFGIIGGLLILSGSILIAVKAYTQYQERSVMYRLPTVDMSPHEDEEYLFGKSSHHMRSISQPGSEVDVIMNPMHEEL
ncbi:hypothetical protein CYMTET_41592 [Cymbomonas tetramitiformis]|uniref:SEA domain-containing protein n=1 Tax=Cymbomonas tetramitiformis TaxID=36881 RepID=A0AAE0F3G0_9CHLO|nr:hypothetical protein CYMTET_41592 [Cymbomonas tetramitiformis]